MMCGRVVFSASRSVAGLPAGCLEARCRVLEALNMHIRVVRV